MASSKRVTREFLQPQALWICWCIIISGLSFISMCLLAYLKLCGQLTPFLFHDNLFYNVYYFLLFMFSIPAFQFPYISVKQSNLDGWYVKKCLGCFAFFFELQANLHYIFNYAEVSLDIETDSEAEPYIIGLVLMSIIRMFLFPFAIYFGSSKLAEIAQRKSLDPHLFGSVFQFFSDFIIIELYLYTAYLYSFSLPMVLMLSLISYVYYKHIRA